MTSPASPSLDRKQVAVIGLLVIVALWGYYRYVFTPLFQAAMQTNQAARTANSRLREMEQAFSQEPQLRQQHLQLKEQVARLRAVIPMEEGLPVVMEQLTTLAGQTGVKIQSLTPQLPLINPSESIAPKESKPRKGSKSRKGAKAKHEPSTPKAGSQTPAYTEIPIQLEALTGFHQLGAFLSRVEQGEPPMQVRSLRINENPKLLRRQAVKMTLVVYAMPSMPSGKPAVANAPRSAGPGGS